MKIAQVFLSVLCSSAANSEEDDETRSGATSLKSVVASDLRGKPCFVTLMF